MIAAGEDVKVDEVYLEAALLNAMSTLRIKDAADTVAGAYGLPRRDIYQMALRLQGAQKNNTRNFECIKINKVQVFK